ncbi:MAG TPA: response regulator [Bryobacteraceae bacterium]|nr:response regulator [Bryobacteraceae bacterium]
MAVEDSPADVVLLRQALDTHMGKGAYDLRVLPDGARGMRYVENFSERSTPNADSLVPDLVVMDINLPVYNGLEILRRLRKHGALSAVPVVVLTTSDSAIEREQAERLGISCFIRKPAELVEFIAIGAAIKSCLKA